ncbi:tetratricopeptide repeat protein [Virgisporangium aurantiacum]|uniref:XRE family transcriptional regulator n=1 Tax=Virgisporangium aurantiacum TaxID=175570 RepID=A0A8J4E8H7_9ACTN|nr:tetratricopeptide repeat protein [Virgisporangium aurantiacum]GIJ62802.1 XRE family transcriptional regulator [Virgisporangium aurantiacum]
MRGTGEPTLGALVRTFRLRTGLTQRELAGKARLSVRAVRDIEQDRVAHPRLPSLHRLAEALALSDADRLALVARAGDIDPGPSATAGPLPRIAVLGPLAVTGPDGAVELPSERVRHLLALLAIQPGRTVPYGEIIAAVWPADPPRTARRLVHAYVARLRGLLEPGRAGHGHPAILAAAPGGVRLTVDEDRLDALRFESSARRGTKALAAGDLEAAREQFNRALACWRGPALSDVDGRLRRHPAVDALRRHRVAVAIAFADTAIDHGDHEEAEAQLRPAIVEDPLHEGLNARLMLALAGSAQQADALALFQDLRARLADELGIEPGPLLQETHLRVLRHDVPPARNGGRAVTRHKKPTAAAAPPATTATPPGIAVPAQLPPDVAQFAGRDHQLRTLDEMLTRDAADNGQSAGAPRIVMLVGGAGVGKTALAVRWAHRVRAAFPDGQLYVNLRGFAVERPQRPLQVLADFLRALGVPAENVPTGVEGATALFRSLLADRRMLVVLDNARDPDHVRPFLPAAAGCLVLITSRSHLTGLAAREGARRLRLGVLGATEARDLLVTLLDQHPEVTALDDLVRSCARLPLALRVAAANLNEQRLTVADYVARLSAGPRLTELQSGGDHRSAVRHAFDVSYAALPADARRVFRLMSLAPGPDVTAEAAGRLLDRPAGDAAALLDRLAGAHLVDLTAPGRYTFHDLLRLYSVERTEWEDPPAERAAARGRLFEWYLQRVEAAARQLYPEKSRLPLPVSSAFGFSSHTDASAWLEAERPTLIAVVQEAASGLPHVAWLLADLLRGYFFMRMNVVDWLIVARAGLAAATAAGDLTGQASAHLSLAAVDRCQGQYHPAVDSYREALALARRAGWVDGESSALGNLASTYWHLGRFPAAADHYTQAIALCRSTGWLAGEATAQGNLGALYLQMGRLREAADRYGEAVELARRTGSRPGEAINLANLGEVYHALGRSERARAHLDRALALHRETGNRGAEAEATRILAEVRADTGELQEGHALAVAAVALAREIGERQDEANALNTLGGLHRRAGRWAAAVEAHSSALRIAQEIEAGYPEAIALLGLAAAALGTGDSVAARTAAGDALAIAARTGYGLQEGQARVVLARLRASVDDADRALAILTGTGHRAAIAEARSVLEDARRRRPAHRAR